ncbi:MAG: hypothetical protein RIQ56_282, partial [Candidatus Parcubacteria bacterium]
ARQAPTTKANHFVVDALQQLQKYFSDRAHTFKFPLDPHGTPFQKSVWRALLKIRPGSTVTYGELARRSGYPGAARAVGSAMRKNPLCIAVPCHRVVPSTAGRSIGNYSAGVWRKEWLLRHESRQS